MTRGTTCTNTEHATIQQCDELSQWKVTPGENLSLCCRKMVSTNHLWILLLKSRWGAGIRISHLLDPCEGQHMQQLILTTCMHVCCTLKEVLLRSKRVSKILHLGQEL